MRRAAALILACALIAGEAHAQGKHDGSLAGSLSGEAKAAYEEARAYYKQGEWEKSLAATERAQKASPDPRLFWNMAACEKKLGRYARAIRHVEAYLAGSSTLLTDEERREASLFLTAARTLVATVRVTSNVEGTEVVVDDDLLGTTPLAKPIVVDEGTHQVRFARSSYRTVDRSERVTANSEVRWSVELVPETPASPPQREEYAPPARPRIGPLVVGGAGAIAAIAGGVLVGISLHQASVIEGECGTDCPPSRWEKYRTMQTAGDVALVAGVGLVIGGVVWWLLSSPNPRADKRAWRPAFTF